MVKFPLKQCAKNRTITVGEWVADDIYYNYPKSEKSLSLKNTILEKNRLYLKSEANTKIGYREVHKEVIKLLGPKFYARLRAATRTIWIAPIEDTLDKYCRYWAAGIGQPYYQKGQVKRSWKVLCEIEQLEKDGIGQIAPLVIYFVSSPKQLRASLGKSLWSKLHNNSLSFNMALVKRLCEAEGENLNSTLCRETPLSKKMFAQAKEILDLFSQVKKTLIRKLHLYCFDASSHGVVGSAWVATPESARKLKWLSKHAKVSSDESINDHLILYNDTEDMCFTLGKKFKSNSPKKMKAYHDSLVREVDKLYREKSRGCIADYTSRMAWLNMYKPTIEKLNTSVGSHKVIVIILDSFELIANEGEKMDHCVLNYLEDVLAQRYIIFSLQGEDQQSTLGIERNHTGLVINQHYGFNNKTVTCKRLNKAASKVLSAIQAEDRKRFKESR